MDDIYLYRIKMPRNQKEIVLPCLNGYTVYINESLDENQAVKAYNHAIDHIRKNDCDGRGDVQEIEYAAHRK